LHSIIALLELGCQTMHEMKRRHCHNTPPCWRYT